MKEENEGIFPGPREKTELTYGNINYINDSLPKDNMVASDLAAIRRDWDVPWNQVSNDAPMVKQYSDC